MMKIAKLLVCSLSFVSAQTFLQVESDSEKCTVGEAGDTTNLDRVMDCSSLTPCYDGMHEEYSDSMCTSPNEKCGAWNTTEFYDGCILK